MRFDPNSNPPSFTSPDQVCHDITPPCYNILTPISQVIEKDTKVRLKVVGTRVDQTEIVRYLLLLNDIANLTFTSVCDCNNKRGPPRRYRLDTAWTSISICLRIPFLGTMIRIRMYRVFVIDLTDSV